MWRSPQQPHLLSSLFFLTDTDVVCLSAVSPNHWRLILIVVGLLPDCCILEKLWFSQTRWPPRSSQEASSPVWDACQVERWYVLRQAQVCSGCHQERCGRRRKGVWRRTEFQMLWIEKGWVVEQSCFAAVSMAIRVSCYTFAGKSKNKYWFEWSH